MRAARPALGHLPNLQPAAADVVRAAQHLHCASTQGAVAVAQAAEALHRAAVHAMARGRDERIRFVATLAVVAADFAADLTPEARERIFARLAMDHDELVAAAATLLISDPTGGRRG